MSRVATSVTAVFKTRGKEGHTNDAVGEIIKGRSPFYPGQPVPGEFFVGRQPQIDRIIKRGAAQVAHGKPVAIFLEGDYGIGKSSLASYVQQLAYKTCGLYPVSTSLGGVKGLDGLGANVLEATVRAEGLDDPRSTRVRNWLAKYIGKQQLFGVSLNMEALRADAPNLSSPLGMLEFLRATLARVSDENVKGISLVLDEINGIASDPTFSTFIKALVDTNALSANPVPLLLILCGTEDKRREMIERHQPIDRIFDVVSVERMSDAEMGEFFTRTFASALMTVDTAGMEMLTFYSAGLPKIMQTIGDAAYFIDQDGVVDAEDAVEAVFAAADDVGRKYVDQQVYKALNSADYQSILAKLAQIGPYQMTFTRMQIQGELNDSEKRKLDNFIVKMKQLSVISPGDRKGEYIFNVRMVRFYIWLRAKNIAKR